MNINRRGVMANEHKTKGSNSHEKLKTFQYLGLGVNNREILHCILKKSGQSEELKMIQRRIRNVGDPLCVRHWIFGFHIQRYFSPFLFHLRNLVILPPRLRRWLVVQPSSTGKHSRMVWRFKVTSCARSSLHSTRFSQKTMVGYFSNWMIF